MSSLNRLVTFGCSYTYGHGLSDCYNINTGAAGLTPSKLGWVNIIANSFNLDCVNLSRPGSSNKQIWHTISNTKFQDTDTVIILWSLKERSCLIKDDFITQLGMRGGWSKTKENKLFQMFSACKTDYDIFFENAVYIDLANYYLQSKNLNVYNFSVMPDFFDYEVDWMQTHIDDLALELSHPIDLALDESHPGPQSNQLFAQKVKSHFRKDMKK